MIRGRKSSSAVVGCEVPVRQPSREPRKGRLEMSQAREDWGPPHCLGDLKPGDRVKPLKEAP